MWENFGGENIAEFGKSVVIRQIFTLQIFYTINQINLKDFTLQIFCKYWYFCVQNGQDIKVVLSHGLLAKGLLRLPCRSEQQID